MTACLLGLQQTSFPDGVLQVTGLRVQVPHDHTNVYCARGDVCIIMIRVQAPHFRAMRFLCTQCVHTLFAVVCNGYQVISARIACMLLVKASCAFMVCVIPVGCVIDVGCEMEMV